MDSKNRVVLDRPLKPVIGRRIAPTRRRMMTIGICRAVLALAKGRGLRAAADPECCSTIAIGNSGIKSAARQQQRHWERGRRRTRQDQISLEALRPVKLRTERSAPNEENLFLLPDRFYQERTLLLPRASFGKYDPAV
jgi:hypothetical protein